ncbi:MAG: glycosyltransferase family 4 protein [Chloroflexota bacterium]
MAGLRILFNVFNLYGKGTYRRAFFLARELVKMGEKVDLLCSSYDRKKHIFETDGVRIISMPNLFGGAIVHGYDPYNILIRCLWAINKKYDIVHSFESRPSVLFSSLLLRIKNAMWIVDWADWFGKGGAVEERENLLFGLLLRPFETFFENRRKYASGITTISTFLKEKSISMGFSPTHVLYLPNGASPQMFQVSTSINIRETLKIQKSSKVIGYVGAAFKQDVEFMLAAFRLVLNSFPNTILLWIGNRSEIDVLESEHVICTGYVPEEILPAYFLACDIFWLPLRKSNANNARLPLKLMDYLASGKPIVSTSVGDIPKIIGEYQVGFLVKDDVAEFALATNRLLSDENLLRELGKNALLLAEQRYTWQILAKQLKEFYCLLLGDLT